MNSYSCTWIDWDRPGQQDRLKTAFSGVFSRLLFSGGYRQRDPVPEVQHSLLSISPAALAKGRIPVHIQAMVTKQLTHKGHLIDTGLLSSILNLIIGEGADYEISDFDVGKVPSDESSIRILLKAENEVLLDATAAKLTALGVQAVGETEAQWVEILKDRGALCVKLRDIKKGDFVLVGSSSVRVFLPESESGGKDTFAFMNNDVSSERNATQSAEKIAAQIREIRENGGKVVVVAGPVVIHTGGADALAALVRGGWIGGFLGGNAIAVHDLEYRLFGTSLGVDLATGRPTHEGHKNHMMAINTVYNHGSIEAMMSAGELGEGLMYEVIRTGIPYCLAGSIRDDGPLPETEMDMIKAQQAYAEIVAGSDMILIQSRGGYQALRPGKCPDRGCGE